MRASARVGAVCLAALVLAAPIASNVHGQQLQGRSRVELQAGMTFPGGTSTATVGNIVSETQSVGAFGALAVSHWVGEQLAVTLSVGASVVDVESHVGGAGVVSRTAIMTPLMGGVRYYFPRSRVGSGFRPYTSFAIGPVFGTESESSVGATIVNRSTTRTAFGGRAGAGFDIPFANSWMFGMFAGYCLMTDFSVEIGSHDNHSSPDFGVSISWLWGGSG